MIISHTLRTYIQPFYCVIIVMHLGWQRRFVPLHRNCENHWSGLFPTFFVIHTLSFQHISRLQSTLYLFSFLVDVQFMKQRKVFFQNVLNSVYITITHIFNWQNHLYQYQPADLVYFNENTLLSNRWKWITATDMLQAKIFASAFSPLEMFCIRILWSILLGRSGGGVLLWQVGVASDFDLAPMRGQAFIWTNGGAN